jgi:glyoxylase-like metal-dependent hydrolase (beta-lactamase superfamily II)
LIDTGFDDSFAKHPPYGNHTEGMKLFNWINGVTNRQEPGSDLRTQLARMNVHPEAVFFTHLHPDHTGGVPALGPQTRFIFGNAELAFWPASPPRTTSPGKSNFSTIDFSAGASAGPSRAECGRLW